MGIKSEDTSPQMTAASLPASASRPEAVPSVGEPPPLPRAISSNGSEIWDWAAAFSAYTQRRHKIAELTRDIAGIGTRCGDCDKWMKSRQCPKEYNVNGRNRGPSCNDHKCSQFIEATSASTRRTDLQKQLTEIDAPAGSSAPLSAGSMHTNPSASAASPSPKEER